MVLPVAGVAAPPTYNADACIGPLRSHLRQAAPNTPGQAGRTVAGFDAGRNWHPVRTTAVVANTFTAAFKNPKRDQTPEGVGLRISATDSEGDTVKQTMPTAYKVH
ncbi:hypothetical protein AB0919_37700 [Streptomyces sp. NPDC046994]|uniref:hypothetical protein n=1 Tax=Streptomyces sp. NPDC046994 TaxID=3155735 RepID=UPI003456946F